MRRQPETPEQIIARVGWMVQLVGADHGAPSFAYTIGLTAKNLPELIIFALPFDVGGYALNVLAKRLTDGEQFECERRIKDVLSADVLLIETSRERTDQYMYQAMYAYPHYRALQVVWPDPQNGAFPWEMGYQDKYKSVQPLLRPTLQ